MKTPIFFIAAIAAFFALPVDFTVMTCVLFAAGFAAILLSDYRQTHRPLRVNVAAGVVSKQALRLAA